MCTFYDLTSGKIEYCRSRTVWDIFTLSETRLFLKETAKRGRGVQTWTGPTFIVREERVRRTGSFGIHFGVELVVLNGLQQFRIDICCNDKKHSESQSCQVLGNTSALMIRLFLARPYESTPVMFF